MTTATQNLEDDHIHILRLTEIMEHMTYESEADVSHLENIVDIIINFADRIHHAKEEDVFFPFLSQRGFSNSQGPIGVMLHEHVTGRNLVQSMAENIAFYKQGDKKALEKAYQYMRDYAELLRSHIFKENNILFRIADRVLTQEDNEELLLKFGKTKPEEIPSEEYIKRIDALAVLYAI